MNIESSKKVYFLNMETEIHIFRTNFLNNSRCTCVGSKVYPRILSEEAKPPLMHTFRGSPASPGNQNIMISLELTLELHRVSDVGLDYYCNK